MKIFKFIFSVSIALIFFTACNKEGKGGSATIKGTIMENLLISSLGKVDTAATYESKDTKVFIIYGDNETFDDDTRTSYNGKYEFDYLYEGEYTIYVYSECILHIDSCPSKSETFIEKITINSSKETVGVPTITISNYK